MERYEQIDPQSKALKAQKGKIWAEIKVIRGQEDVLNKAMEEIRKELEQTNAEKDETRAQVDAVQEKIEKVEAEMKAIYEVKDAKREAYWKGRFDYKVQANEIDHINWMQRQKDKVVQQKQQRQEREEERKEVIKSLPHPFMRELDCCDHLTGYINAMKERLGLIIDSEKAAREL